MIRNLISVAMILLLVGHAGCGMDLGNAIRKEFEDNKDGILREFSELRDGFLEEINEWSNYLGTHSITEDHDLIGNRQKGTDNYVGAYEAAYTQFDGEEYIFGGTSLKRKDGSDLRVTYSLTVQSGKATLYWMEGDGEVVIADASDQGVYEMTIHAGKNFIVLRGEKFTGDLSLHVE